MPDCPQCGASLLSSRDDCEVCKQASVGVSEKYEQSSRRPLKMPHRMRSGPRLSYRSPTMSDELTSRDSYRSGFESDATHSKTPSRNEAVSSHGDIPLGYATVAHQLSPEELDALDKATEASSSGNRSRDGGGNFAGLQSLRRRRTDTLLPVSTPNLRAVLEASEQSNSASWHGPLLDASEPVESASLRELTRASMELGESDELELSIPLSSHELTTGRARPTHETLTDDPSFRQLLPELPPDPLEARRPLGKSPTSLWDSVLYARRARSLETKLDRIQQVLDVRHGMLSAEHDRLVTEAGRVTWATGEALAPALEPKLQQVLSLETALDDLRAMCHRVTVAWENESSRIAAIFARQPASTFGDARASSGSEIIDATAPAGNSLQPAPSAGDDIIQRKQRLDTIRVEYERQLQELLEELRGKEATLSQIYESVVDPLKQLGLTQLESGRPKYLAGQFRRLRSCKMHDSALNSQVREARQSIDRKAVRRGKYLVASFVAMVLAFSALGIAWWSLS